MPSLLLTYYRRRKRSQKSYEYYVHFKSYGNGFRSCWVKYVYRRLDDHRHHLVHYWGIVDGRPFVDCPESFKIYGTGPQPEKPLRLLST